MSKTYPCDGPEGQCPFDAIYSEDCRYHCGLGVDEDELDDINYCNIPDDELSEPLNTPERDYFDHLSSMK